jgi:hypothetical protein
MPLEYLNHDASVNVVENVNGAHDYRIVIDLKGTYLIAAENL